MNRLDSKQKDELKRRRVKYKCTCGVINDFCKCEVQINRDTTCKCGFEFGYEEEDYTVDGVKYPIITDFSDCEGDQNWTEDHKCPKCKEDSQYRDGT